MARIIDAGPPWQTVETIISSPFGSVSADARIIDGTGGEVPGTGTSPADPGEGVTPEPYFPVVDTREMWLESIDGTVVIPLSVRFDRDRMLRGGVKGHMLPPNDVVTGQTPGMEGTWLQEINIGQREVFLPLAWGGDTHEQFRANLDELINLVSDWDDIVVGQTGTFRLFARSATSSERYLDVTYVDGLQGSWGNGDSGANWERPGLTLVAVDPYWRARKPVELIFRRPTGSAFLGDGTGTAPWPRRLTPSVVIGDGMEVIVEGTVKAWPEVDLTGPAVTAAVRYPGTNIVIPNGVPNSSTLRLTTDPRRRSARIDGAIAWSRINLGSTFSALKPGRNVVDVELGASGTDTRLVIRYLPGYKSAF